METDCDCTGCDCTGTGCASLIFAGENTASAEAQECVGEYIKSGTTNDRPYYAGPVLGHQHICYLFCKFTLH